MSFSMSANPQEVAWSMVIVYFDCSLMQVHGMVDGAALVGGGGGEHARNRVGDRGSEGERQSLEQKDKHMIRRVREGI